MTKETQIAEIKRLYGEYARLDAARRKKRWTADGEMITAWEKLKDALDRLLVSP